MVTTGIFLWYLGSMNKFLVVLMVVMVAAVGPATARDLNPVGDSSMVVAVKDAPAARSAQKFIDSVAARGIGFLADQKTTPADQQRAFRNLLRESFDLPTIGRFALGKYWRGASAAERQEYMRLFENLVVDVYSARFASYNGQRLVTTQAIPTDQGDVIVKSQIIPAGQGEKINVDWVVRPGANGMKIVDVVVEGISMAITQRSDFSAVIGRAGGDVSTLIAHLKNGRKS
jgi:phospholipid transport system substrate-binding protein